MVVKKNLNCLSCSSVILSRLTLQPSACSVILISPSSTKYSKTSKR